MTIPGWVYVRKLTYSIHTCTRGVTHVQTRMHTHTHAHTLTETHGQPTNQPINQPKKDLLNTLSKLTAGLPL